MDIEVKSQDTEHRSRCELARQRRRGIKAPLEFENPQWWTEGFISYIESIASPRPNNAAKNYVKSGKVVELTVTPGLIEARVQGRRKLPYHVRLYSPIPTTEQLEEVKRRLADKAIYKALLLSGEIPRELNEIFTMSGIALMPEDYARSQLQCTCPEPENICKHILAVLYVVSATFDRDPFLLLQMRGFDKESLLSSLTAPVETQKADNTGAYRGMSESSSSGHDTQKPGDADIHADTLPLDAAFYGARGLYAELMDLRTHPIKPGDSTTPHAPLFDFPLWRGETSFRDSIDPYYASVEKLLREK
ncbi:MAG: SWIM zinc finger family protein [Synergistaceae bacterium]|jgi:uncharacterized Zn finger protein|nr:SWIM zinc finger family protein [Synergistaceae bacterium]